MKHTKEPWVGMVKGRFNSNHYWHADNDNSSCSTAAPIFAGGEVVCLAVSTDYEMQELEANAQRIVDCVNACSGMENPQAEITTLRAELEIAKKDGWISVKDRMPENVHIEHLTVGHSKAVLGYVKDNLCTFCVSYDYEHKAWRYFCDSNHIVRHEITHWQPLPEPPKE